MGNYDDLYNILQQADEERKRNNFNSFMTKLDDLLVKDLNTYFKTDKEQYAVTVRNLKAQGIRVFRNDKGEHKLEFKHEQPQTTD